MEYEEFLREIRLVNRWAGDAWALKSSLLREIETGGHNFFSVLDVGAGSGELLRETANFARKAKRKLRAVGLELNARSARAIREESAGYDVIAAVRGDALRLPFADDSFDYAICSLFTHHFSDQQAAAILKEMARISKKKLFVIDLHRHSIAYLLYTTVGRIFLRGRLVRQDGALSILRGFRPDELAEISRAADLQEVRVKRSFPFRLVLTGRK
jgi:ubiquinone/menaquinone biosynthesis C-methylase UbiE